MTFVLLSCSHTAQKPIEQTDREPAAAKLMKADDPRLKKGELTVWKLQEMVQAGEFDALNRLFNNGANMSALPLGYSAGTGGRVLGMPTDAGLKILDIITGSNWRGKIFFKSADRRSSRGLNRIRRVLLTNDAPIVPMAAFTTQLLDKHPLVPDVRSNFVVLNYTNPITKNYLQERILTQIQVYDIMVAVPGKYGPIYIGKTWLGRYDAKGEFTAFNPNQLIAWYFLDFNQAALDDQIANHWDNTEEIPIDYNN